MGVHKLLLAAAMAAFLSNAPAQDKETICYSTVGASGISVGGELHTRLEANLKRLQETKYQPDNVFLTEEQSGNWPGDTEGRTILGLVMDCRALNAKPLYLDEIIRRVPAHLNSQGYMGTIHPGELDEQQLSGNGWMLRGLCEYSLWKNRKDLFPMIRKMAENLFCSNAALYDSYPISPDGRLKDIGGASGNIAQTVGHWRLSSDIGCVFIGMDGLLQALQVTGDKTLAPEAEKLVNLFLKVDIAGIKAQTHASLTAMRGLIRYADIKGDPSYVKAVEDRWKIYKELGMTEFYANYNWFRRYDTWTEPCAIVDAFMVAVQLWQHTGKAEYRNDAELIYYNALCPAQRPNGGFGLENVLGKERKTYSITPNCDEAHWCCTMRGGEGLGRAAEYSAFNGRGELAFPFLRSVSVNGNGGAVAVDVETDYPFAGEATAKIKEAPKGRFTLSFAKYPWVSDYVVKVNGKTVKYAEANGLAKVRRRFKKGDVVSISFRMTPRYEETINKENTSPEKDFRVLYGPLLLGGAVGNEANVVYGENLVAEGKASFKGAESGTELSPIYQLLSPSVLLSAKPAYSRRIIFTR